MPAFTTRFRGSARRTPLAGELLGAACWELEAARDPHCGPESGAAQHRRAWGRPKSGWSSTRDRRLQNRV